MGAMGTVAQTGRSQTAQELIAEKAAADRALHAQAKQLVAQIHGDPAKLHALLTGLSAELRDAVLSDAQRVHGNRFVQEAVQTHAAPTPAAPIDPQARIDAVVHQVDDVKDRAAHQIPGTTQAKITSTDPLAKREAALETSLHGQLGVGDEKGFTKFLANNQTGLRTFTEALGGGSGGEHPSTSDLYRLAMIGLKAHLPDATFQLVLAEQKYGGGGPGVVPAQGPLIAATANKVTSTYKLEEGAFAHGQDLVGILERAGLADEWYAAFKTLHSHEYAELDAGAADKSLRKAFEYSIGGGAVIAAVLKMAPADQAKFLAAFDKAAGLGPNAQLMVGGLVVKAGVPPKFVAAAPADHLANGEPAPKESTVTLSLDGATEPHRNWNFVDKNYKQVVGAQLAQHTLRGSEPRTLIGTDLENEIGTSMGEPEDHKPESSQDLEKLGQRRWNCFEGNARVTAIAKKLRDKGGDHPAVLVVPILFDSKNAADTGLVQFPLFRVGDSLVDHTGRVYNSFNDWRKSNHLPAGRISYPKGLALHETAPGQVDVATEDTHAKHPSNMEKAEAVLDKAALVGGIIIGGAAILGSGGTALLVAGGATAAYGAARSAENLDDRHDHEQSINPFTSSEARAEWLSFGANALAIASLGTTAVAGKLASETAEASATGARAVSASQIMEKAAKVADAGAQLNTANDLRRDWAKLSPGERASITLQLGFWGLQKAATPAAEAPSPYSAEHAETTLAEAIEPAAVAHDATAGTKAEVEPAAHAKTKPAAHPETKPAAHPEARAPETKPVEAKAPERDGPEPAPSKFGDLFNRLRGKASEPSSAHEVVERGIAELPDHASLRAAVDQMVPGRIVSLAELMSLDAYKAMPAADQATLVKLLVRDTAAGRGANAEQLYDAVSKRPDNAVKILASVLHSDFAAIEFRPEAGPMQERQHAQLGEIHEISKPGGSHLRFEVTLPSGHAVEVIQQAPGAPPKGYRYPTPSEVQHAISAQLPGAMDGLRKIFLTATPVDGKTLSHAAEHQPPTEAPARVTGKELPPRDSRYLGLFRGQTDVIQLRPMRIIEAADHASATAIMQAEWTQTLTHEVGHALDDLHAKPGDWDASAATGEGSYAGAMAADKHDISGYGRTNHQEDFAETYSVYAQVLGTPREAEIRAIYSHRFAFIDRLLASGAPKQAPK